MLALPATGPAGTRACRTLVVTGAAVRYPHFRSVAAALARARPCDWVLVAPGTYPGPVTVRTPDLHLRGLDRNRVVLDGGHRAANGIEVRADGVSVENLTVRNFDRASRNDEEAGNELRWQGVHGWRARYVTAYDTGLLGGYGFWASRSSGGRLDHVYASGFDDSGLYVGACRDCETTIADAVAERSAAGLAVTNGGGHLVVEDSLFAGNALGATLNSSESDPPAPQLGTCDAGANRSPTPSLAGTRLARCTILRRDRLLGNDALDVPVDTSSAWPGWGLGVALLGASGDLVADDRIAGNRNVGVLAVEFPFAPPRRPGALRFQLAGNRLAGDRVTGSRLALALEGGLFGARRSVDDCVAGALAPSLPPVLAAWSCARPTTPNPPAASSRRVLALVRRLQAQLLAHVHRPQPAPPPQPSLPHPCAGVPANPLC